MTSDKQMVANRRNALASTGPRSSAGKATVRLNALKHGLLSQEVLLPDEDPRELGELGKQLREQLQPVGEMEELLVDRILASLWRLKRLGRVEAGLFTWKYYESVLDRELSEADKRPARTQIGAHSWRTDPKRQRKEDKQEIIASIKDPKARARVDDAEEQMASSTATLGQAFFKDAEGPDAFSKLSRYESGIERSLFKALHELQRLQDARMGRPVVPPIAVDVNVSTDQS
jgi:hypothetical protein